MNGTGRDRLDRVLAAAALWCAALTLVVVASSAWLRLVQAGPGCVPWPACYGSISEATRDAGGAMGEAVRLTHRVAAMGVSVVTLLIVAIAWKRRPVRTAWRAAAVAILVLVAALAVLGRVTPGARHVAIALGNLAGGFTLLALSWALAVSARQRFLPEAAPPAPFASVTATVSLAATAAAAASGSYLSAAYLGMGCETLPFCPAGTSGAGLHELHRASAAAALAGWSLLAFGRARIPRYARQAAAIALAALAGGAALGAANADLGLPLAVSWLHNLLAAIALCAATSAWLASRGANRVGAQVPIAANSAPSRPA
jgi:cytochrome c oxidase assembly protein subunit 15